jgi:hypothetical protein
MELLDLCNFEWVVGSGEMTRIKSDMFHFKEIETTIYKVAIL